MATALRAKGALAQALEIAKLGLKLPGHGKAQLAEWTGALAEGLGQPDTSLQARLAAFAEVPTLTDYLKIQALTEPDEWPKCQKKLLDSLRQGYRSATPAAVDIFLHEGLLEDAIAVVDSSSSYNSAPIQQVMAAAIAERPDWVITNARRRAESIMDEGKAKYYGYAVDWLKLIHRAYQQSGELKKWQTYHGHLLQKHSRKRKLMDMLRHFA